LISSFLKTTTGDHLEKKEIRTHYSGVILFIAKMVTVATGIIFTLVVANTLAEADYGTFGFFTTTMISYFTLFSGPITFWTMRFAARDKEGATKTGTAGNMALATIATLVYLALLPIITASPELQKYVLVYVVAAAQIIETYLINVFEACLQAKRPHFVGYGLLVGEVLKVLFVYLFVIRLQLGLLGAVLSLVVAFAIKMAFYFKIIWKELQQKIVLSYIKEWLKGSAFNLYSILGDRIAAVIFLMLTIYGGTTAYGYWYAPLQIANVITYSTFLAFALQPKLLADPNLEEATVSLRIVLMFAIPMTAGVLALPTSYLIFLKESGYYLAAAPVLVILAIDALISTVSTIFTYVLYGIEKVDEKAKIPFDKVVKSRLFIAFSLPYVHSAIALPTAFYVLNTFAGNNPVLMATYVAAINTVVRLITFIVLYRVLRKAVKVRIPWKSIGEFVGAASVMALVLFSAHPTRRFDTLALTAVGGLIYLGLLIAVDKEIRAFVHTILQKVGKQTERIRKPQTKHSATQGRD
jgi:O-antigen/teichoic acid export membrane protein